MLMEKKFRKDALFEQGKGCMCIFCQKILDTGETSRVFCSTGLLVVDAH